MPRWRCGAGLLRAGSSPFPHSHFEANTSRSGRGGQRTGEAGLGALQRRSNRGCTGCGGEGRVLTAVLC